MEIRKRLFAPVKILAIIKLLVLCTTVVLIVTIHSGYFTKSDTRNYHATFIQHELFPLQNIVVERGRANELIYFGSNKTIAAQFNTPEMLKKYSSPENSSLVKRFPQFICIGVAKCGTSTVKHFLRHHPKIVETITQEPNFFGKDYGQSLEKYLKQMKYSTSEQITFDKTPSYFYSENKAERIFEFDSRMKLLLIVKEPVQRTLSHYIHFDNGQHPLISYLTDKNGNLRTKEQAISVSTYDKHMQRWFEIFPKCQIHVIDGDNFIKNPFQELHEIETFLDIGHYFQSEMFVSSPDKEGFYCLKTSESGDTFCMPDNKGRVNPNKTIEQNIAHQSYSVDEKKLEAVLKKLREYFKTHNSNFFKMINKEFDWD